MVMVINGIIIHMVIIIMAALGITVGIIQEVIDHICITDIMVVDGIDAIMILQE
tara:strand:- start:28 stop:189 length:162 start_codon:yes stop_codon:yes gene_type:complete